MWQVCDRESVAGWHALRDLKLRFDWIRCHRLKPLCGLASHVLVCFSETSFFLVGGAKKRRSWSRVAVQASCVLLMAAGLTALAHTNVGLNSATLRPSLPPSEWKNERMRGSSRNPWLHKLDTNGLRPKASFMLKYERMGRKGCMMYGCYW